MSDTEGTTPAPVSASTGDQILTAIADMRASIAELDTRIAREERRRGLDPIGGEPAAVVCPPWCVDTQTRHRTEFRDWDGNVLHHSSTHRSAEWEWEVMATTYTEPDGRPTSVTDSGPVGVTLHIYQVPDSMSVDEALALGMALVQLVQTVEVSERS